MLWIELLTVALLLPHANALQSRATTEQGRRGSPPTRAGPAILPFGGSARGLCNLDGGPQAEADDPAFERFQQINLQWPDIEPEEGRFDWSLAEEMVRNIVNVTGRMAAIKINSNIKPDWLYNMVPWSNVTWFSEQHDGRTAMYWHPTYVALLRRRINATAAWLTSVGARGIAYMRQTWAPIGEEDFGIPDTKGEKVKRLRNGSNWHVPDGCKTACDPPPSWEKVVTDTAYKKEVGQTWRVAFNRSLLPKEDAKVMPLLLLRAGEYDGAFALLSAADMGRDGFGWFHTGAAMEQTQCFNQTFRYAPFRADCLPGTVACFAEACPLDLFAGPSATKRTPALEAANFSRLQAVYWMMLSNMDSGISVTGLHSSKMLKPWLTLDGYKKAFTWADAYMGLHASPYLAPGAWVAFRGAGDDHPPYGDFGFLMHRLEIDSTKGLQQCGGDKDAVPYAAWCREVMAGSGIYLALEQRTRASFNKGQATFRLVYWAPAHLELYCDDGSSSGKLAISTVDRMIDGKMWKEVSATVQAATLMKGGGKSGSDVWLLNKGSSAARVHLVEVTKEPATNAVTISALDQMAQTIVKTVEESQAGVIVEASAISGVVDI